MKFGPSCDQLQACLSRSATTSSQQHCTSPEMWCPLVVSELKADAESLLHGVGNSLCMGSQPPFCPVASAQHDPASAGDPLISEGGSGSPDTAINDDDTEV